MENILEKIRNEKGLTKKEMSEILEISDSFYSRIETGKKPISKKLFEKITLSFNLNEEDTNKLKEQQMMMRMPEFLCKEQKTSGEILREFRKRKNLTGEMLGEILNCSHQFIFKLENGEEILPSEKLEILREMMAEEEYAEFIQAVEHEKLKNIPGQLDLFNFAAKKGIEEIDFDDIQSLRDEKLIQGLNRNEITIKISEKSMMPEFKDGDIITANTSLTEIKEERFFIVNYEGNIYLKQVIQRENIYFLHSVNPYYPDIEVENLDNFKIIGQVIKSVRNY